MRCNRCNQEIDEGRCYVHRGETLCDDCYLEAVTRAKACDPWAVHHAKSTRERLGLDGTEGLTARQKEIYDFIKRRGKVTPAELVEALGLSQSELETQFAILRHCELVRGYKENSAIFITTFDQHRSADTE